MTQSARPAAAALGLLATLVLTGLIAGFFYAYSVSAIRGLDAAGPETALAAMRGINAEARNAAFFPAFFLPPAAGAAAAWAASRSGAAVSARWFAAGAATYLLGGLILTLVVHVPMNEALAAAALPSDPFAAAALWRGYAGPWLAWNHVRTGLSIVSLALVGAGLAALPTGSPSS